MAGDDDVEEAVDIIVIAIEAWRDQRSLGRRIPQLAVEQ